LQEELEPLEPLREAHDPERAHGVDVHGDIVPATKSAEHSWVVAMEPMTAEACIFGATKLVWRHEPLVEGGVRRRVDDNVHLAGDLVGELGSDADVGLPYVADDGNQLPCDEAAVVAPVDFLQASEQLRVHYLHIFSMSAEKKNMVIWMNEECWLVCEKKQLAPDLILQSPQCCLAVLGLDQHVYLANVRIRPQNLLDKNWRRIKGEE
jgi:hypothetical protein